MQEKTYTTELGKIVYWRSDATDPSKPWIIFLPGLTADHRLFDKQVVHFKDMANLLVSAFAWNIATIPFEMDHG